MPYLYTLGQLIVAPAVKTFLKPRVEGLENVPATGGAVLAGNHLSVADEYILGSVVPRHIAYWAKSDYFTGTGVAGFLMRQLMEGLGAIAVNREGGRAALSALDAGIPALKRGDLVAVYAEGTRSPDGRLYRGRTGAVRLAMMGEVPIIPVGCIGTERVQPIGTHVPKLGVPSTIKFGKPLDFVGKSMDGATLRACTDELMAEIQRLTGQEYVPRYAPKRDAPSEG